MNLGENIYMFRTKNGLSQGDVANALEVSRQSVSKWENNVAVPELDKLMKLSELFGTSLDELVSGEKPAPVVEASQVIAVENAAAREHVPMKTVIGLILLVFGMLSFLLSVFWGDHLRVGEEVGEFVSICVVLISITLISTYNFNVLSTCAVVYFLYSVICYAILNVTSMRNYVFMFILGSVILIWFIVLGTHATKDKKEQHAWKS